MAAQSQASVPGEGTDGRSHGRRIFLIWIVIALVSDLLIWFVLGPHLPPGTMTLAATEEQGAIKLMSVMSAPVFVLVMVYFVYSLIVWRQRQGDTEDGPPIHGNSRIQTTWIVGTSVIVLALAVFGTVSLISSNGAGAGEGPAPIWKPAGVVSDTSWSPGSTLQVQVIAQQWRFTYRYPQFGGVETTVLMLPENQWVQFNVTSLDVIHSFWAYQLGVKADANPGVNNVAYTKPTQLGGFRVECAELCGLWHGAMFNFGKVVSPAAFQAWAGATETQLASVTALLPPYSTTYEPAVIPLFKLGTVVKKLGLFGAGGGFYPPQDPAQP